MGLEERRMIKTLTEDVLPGRVSEIEEICGVAVPYNVDWDSFDGDLAALNFVDNISCHRLNMALRVICATSRQEGRPGHPQARPAEERQGRRREVAQLCRRRAGDDLCLCGRARRRLQRRRNPASCCSPTCDASGRDRPASLATDPRSLRCAGVRWGVLAPGGRGTGPPRCSPRGVAGGRGRLAVTQRAAGIRGRVRGRAGPRQL